MLHKSASYSLLTSDGLQNRWRASAATSFIRRKSKFRFHYVYLVATILLVLIVYISLPPTKKVLTNPYLDPAHLNTIPFITYNSTYPLTRPIVNSHSHTTIYRIGIIADLDTNSKSKSKSSWSSYYKLGYLNVGASLATFEFKWDTDEPMKISSGYSLKGKSSRFNQINKSRFNMLAFCRKRNGTK